MPDNKPPVSGPTGKWEIYQSIDHTLAHNLLTFTFMDIFHSNKTIAISLLIEL